MLRSIERKIEGLIERTFGRAFRSELQPVELARKLAREMEQHKTVSVSRVYVPNEFAIYLSGADREHFASYENSLRAELANYLDAHARGEGLSMVGEAVVIFETDSDLRVGEFGIACRMADNPGTAAPPAVAPESAADAGVESDLAAAQSAGMSAGVAEDPEPPVVATPSASDPFSAHVTGAGVPAADQGEPLEPEDEPGDAIDVDDALPVDEGDVRHDAPDAAFPPADVGDAPVAPAPAEVLPPDEPGPLDESAPALPPEPEPAMPPVEPDVIEPPPEPLPELPVGLPEDPPLVEPEIGGAAAAAAGAAAIDPPPVHDALEGVSGTQIFTADQAREAGVPTEEMTLVLPGGARHALNRRVTTMGRGRGNDLVIPDANISRNHAEIRHIGLDYFLVDLDSTNGVEVNGEQVRRHALAHGDIVVVGTTEIVVELG